MKATVEVSAQIKSKSEGQVVLELSIPLVRSMISGEEVIQMATNAVGQLATKELMKSLDTDGSAISIGNLRFTSKGVVEKEYETPYGKISVGRHVYQSSTGGNTYCPLEESARIIGSATPKLAKMVANKYTRSSVDEVKSDFSDNHNRNLSRSYIQSIAEQVGNIAISKEARWSYAAELDEAVATISIGMDGAMMLMREDGYREAMSGTIAFYNDAGERLHTDYISASPEYGKAKFFSRMEREISQVKTNYPKANYVGIADGASDNWTFLKKHTDTQITDFYHASEYLASASQAIFHKNQESKRVQWLEQHCHDLKHNKDAVIKQLKEFSDIRDEKKLSAVNKEKLDATITYFTNQGNRMNYYNYRERHLPIGSGVTEAACKTIIKQRLCRSGMRWKNRGASIVIALKCLVQSRRWGQFWDKINQFGVPATV